VGEADPLTTLHASLSSTGWTAKQLVIADRVSSNPTPAVIAKRRVVSGDGGRAHLQAVPRGERRIEIFATAPDRCEG